MENNMLGLRVGNEGNLIIEFNKTSDNVGTGGDVWCHFSIELKTPNVDLDKAAYVTTSEILEVLNNSKMMLEGKINNAYVIDTLERDVKFVVNKDNLNIIINFNYSQDFYSLYLDKNNVERLISYLEKLL